MPFIEVTHVEYNQNGSLFGKRRKKVINTAKIVFVSEDVKAFENQYNVCQAVDGSPLGTYICIEGETMHGVHSQYAESVAAVLALIRAAV